MAEHSYNSDDKDAPSLQHDAQDVVVKSLGELAGSTKSTFSCGGELSSSSEVRVVYKTLSGELKEAVFPGASDADIQQLLAACSVASFGIGAQNVFDQSYRNAFKLDTERFTTSFTVANTPILLEAAMVFLPELSHIRAELYKLNVYSSGGFFKVHVDTPRSEQMIGSLVVCLPTQFSGGELVTRHNGHEIKFDWSSTPQSPRKTVSWAAFYSDVEHEVLPVSQGHRITLTYNLYSGFGLGSPENFPFANITSTPLYNKLRAALASPFFMHDGGVLGFPSQHKYVFTDLNSTERLPFLLKRADRIVYAAAKELGISVIVKPIIEGGVYEHPKFWHHDLHLLPEFRGFSRNYYARDEQSVEDNMAEMFDLQPHRAMYITWCRDPQEFTKEPAGIADVYGNESSIKLYYQTAAVLMGVPQWGEYRRKLHSSGNIREKDVKSESEQVLKRLCFHGVKNPYID